MSTTHRPATHPTPGRRGIGVLAALAVACPSTLVAVAGPAGAEDAPPVRVSATTRAVAEILARDAALRGEPTDVWTTVEGVDGVASSDHRWNSDLPVETVFTCDPGGCAGYDVRAFAEVDEVDGVLRAGAHGSLHVGNPPQDGYGASGLLTTTGDAVVEDSITLSEGATVELTGRLTGLLDTVNTDRDQQPDPEAVLLAQVQFLGAPTWNGEGHSRPVLGGFERRLEAAPGVVAQVVDEPFGIGIDLPAGTTVVRARLLAEVGVDVSGMPGQVYRSVGHVDFDNSLRFGIAIPETVTASSGSGLLPLTGGAPDGEEPADTVAPTLTVTDVTAEATGPGGAAVPLAPAADDDTDPSPVVGCDPASGTVFPLGRTPVTCRATDSAGNGTTETFDVHVVDTTAPELTLPADYTVDVLDPKGRTTVYEATATDLVDPAPVVACTPASGSTLPVGRTTVACTATDAAGNEAAGSFVITVPDTRAVIAQLRAHVLAAPMAENRRSYLLSFLDRADQALADGDARGTRRALDVVATVLRGGGPGLGSLASRLLVMVERVVRQVVEEALEPVLRIVGKMEALVGTAEPALSAVVAELRSLIGSMIAGGGLLDFNLLVKTARDLQKSRSASPEVKALAAQLLVALGNAKGAVG